MRSPDKIWSLYCRGRPIPPDDATAPPDSAVASQEGIAASSGQGRCAARQGYDVVRQGPGSAYGRRQARPQCRGRGRTSSSHAPSS